MRIELSDSGMEEEQAAHASRLRKLWSTHAPLLREAHNLRGGIIWKKARGHEYLYRYFQDPLTGTKAFSGLGRRSPESEAEYVRYLSRREEVQGLLAQSMSRIENAGRIARALRFARFPSVPAEVVHGLWLEGLMDDRLRLMGATAMFAYELEAEILTPPALVRGESLRLLVQGVIDDRLADLATRLVTSSDRAFFEVRRDRDHLVFDGGRGGRIELHSTAALEAYLRDRGLNEDRIDLVMDAMALPAWRGVAVARDARVVPLHAVDPRALTLLNLAAAATEPDQARADLLAKRAGFIAGDVLAGLRMDLGPHQAEAFMELDADQYLRGPRA